MATAASNVHHIYPADIRVNIPTDHELEQIPLVFGRPYRCRPKQADFIRRRCWNLNRDNAVYRFRTHYDGKILTVYRLAK
jgi:hypothetical protein